MKQCIWHIYIYNLYIYITDVDYICKFSKYQIWQTYKAPKPKSASTFLKNKRTKTGAVDGRGLINRNHLPNTGLCEKNIRKAFLNHRSLDLKQPLGTHTADLNNTSQTWHTYTTYSHLYLQNKETQKWFKYNKIVTSRTSFLYNLCTKIPHKDQEQKKDNNKVHHKKYNYHLPTWILSNNQKTNFLAAHKTNLLWYHKQDFQ